MRIDDEDLKKNAEMLRAMGHPARLCVLARLYHSSHNVREMQECLRLPQSTVSQHLFVLRSAGLVSCTKKGTESYYELANPAVRRVLQVLFPGIDASC